MRAMPQIQRLNLVVLGVAFISLTLYTVYIHYISKKKKEFDDEKQSSGSSRFEQALKVVQK